MDDVLATIVAAVILYHGIRWYRGSRRRRTETTNSSTGRKTGRAGPRRADGGTASMRARSPSTRTRRKVQREDPKDSAFWLAQHGWERVNTDPEQYQGHFRAGPVSLRGRLERTPAGRRKFIVHNPSKAFKGVTHNGRCLNKRPDLGPNTYEVHFKRKPDSFGDGIDAINELLVRAHA